MAWSINFSNYFIQFCFGTYDFFFFKEKELIAKIKLCFWWIEFWKRCWCRLVFIQYVCPLGFLIVYWHCYCIITEESDQKLSFGKELLSSVFHEQNFSKWVKKKKKIKEQPKKNPFLLPQKIICWKGWGRNFSFRLFKVMWAMSSVSFDIL